MKAIRSNAPIYSGLNPSYRVTRPECTDISKTIDAAKKRLKRTGGTWFGKPVESPQKTLPL